MQVRGFRLAIHRDKARTNCRIGIGLDASSVMRRGLYVGNASLLAVHAKAIRIIASGSLSLPLHLLSPMDSKMIEVAEVSIISDR